MFAQVNGIRLFFDIEGSSHVVQGPSMRRKPVCFLLHGGPGSDHSDFKPWLSPLAEDMQLVYIDHRGNGRSERCHPSTYTIAQMADDVEALRQYLGLDDIMLLGHSFGGMVAMEYALRYPRHATHLILANTTANADCLRRVAESAASVANPTQRNLLPLLFAGHLNSETEYEYWWEQCLPLYFHRTSRQTMQEMCARCQGSFEVCQYMFRHEIPHFNLTPHLHHIQASTLIVAAQHDWVTPTCCAIDMVNRIPGAKLAVFDDTGHMPFVEAPEEFNRLIKGFIEAGLTCRYRIAG
ncbi:alpha/beta fold hydrolase [Heliophilum fasciatum]|uniref:Proline iminopeptidase n=1 Tax=Heliophilum fasciatum TaxID=35700 RepID=A0A4R2RYB3_9FIRM|nr:alpha/beta fold hydrolase [Heliophilum fasciatum]MCW2276960.1 proline iminopeptidase [Heliophilum fasciatum]TCP68514.1 proline iminopeptidase [Heliophilum fasciatum]